MHRPVFALLLAGLLPALAAASPVGPALREQRADALLAAFGAGRDEEAGRHFDDRLRAGLPPARLAEVRAGLLAQLGAITGRGAARHGCAEGIATVWQRLRFERAELDARVGFNDAGEVAGFFLVPPQAETPCPGQPAAAAVAPDLPEGVRERAVTVGAEGWPLPGLLALPDGPGPFPAVVMVHGSGPNDADQRVGARAPFRDLAHGLARRGIASLRYDKRSRAHAAAMAARTPDFTLDHEVVDDAVAALRFLAGRPEVDPGRRFVLGHSLGALMAPRIAERAAAGHDPALAGAPGALAGIVLLAGPTRPLHWIVVDQVEYLARHQAVGEDAIAGLRAQARHLDALARGAAPGDAPLLLGLPASWWRDLLAYDAPATARALGVPVFVGHAGRDYQVTAADLDGWRQGLRGLDGVHFRTWPGLDHLLGRGEGLSLPADYQQPAAVDDAVIDDLAAWIQARPARRASRPDLSGRRPPGRRPRSHRRTGGRRRRSGTRG